MHTTHSGTYRQASGFLNRKVLLALLVLSLVLGVANNLFNPNRVAWTGSPEVLPKPEGWPTLSAAEGVKAGAAFAWTELLKHPIAVAGALLLLALGMARLRRSETARRRWAMSWWRVFFGVMFLAAAWPKFSDPEGFAMMVAQYQMLPSFAVHAFSIGLPALEVVTGLALLLSPWEREASALLGLLLVMFIVALSQALWRDLGIACGCFDIAGSTDAGETWFALLRDVVLLLPVAWLLRRAEIRALWKF
jgi:putative oxidoreductase